MKPKNCIVCGEEFTPYSSNQIICSEPCRKKRQSDREKNNRIRIIICKFCDVEYKIPNGRSGVTKTCGDCSFILSRFNWHSPQCLQDALNGWRILLIRGHPVWIRPDDYRIKKSLPIPSKILDHIRERLEHFV